MFYGLSLEHWAYRRVLENGIRRMKGTKTVKQNSGSQTLDVGWSLTRKKPSRVACRE